MVFHRKTFKGISNLVGEAILVAIITGWIAVAGQALISTHNSINEEKNLALELLLCTSPDIAVFRTLSSGKIDEIDKNVTIYVFSPETNEWENISLPTFISPEMIVLIKSTGKNYTWISSGSLVYLVDIKKCRLDVVTT